MIERFNPRIGSLTLLAVLYELRRDVELGNKNAYGAGAKLEAKRGAPRGDVR